MTITKFANAIMRVTNPIPPYGKSDDGTGIAENIIELMTVMNMLAMDQLTNHFDILLIELNDTPFVDICNY